MAKNTKIGASLQLRLPEYYVIGLAYFSLKTIWHYVLYGAVNVNPFYNLNVNEYSALFVLFDIDISGSCNGT